MNDLDLNQLRQLSGYFELADEEGQEAIATFLSMERVLSSMPIEDFVQKLAQLTGMKLNIPIEVDDVTKLKQDLIHLAASFKVARTESEKAFIKSKLEDKFEELHKKAKEAVITFEDYETILSDITEATKDFNETIDELQSKQNILATAQEEYNETGQITIDTFQDLRDNDLLQYLDMSTGKLIINKEALAVLS